MRLRATGDYGRGEHSIAPEELAELDAFCAVEDDEALIAETRQHFQSPSYRPPLLPEVALRLQALAQQNEVEIDELLALLNQEPLLAGQVLARAQSAAFGGAVSPLTLRDAVLRLGLKRLRDLVWEAAINLRVFRAPGFMAQMQAVRRHCAVTAEMSAVVAGYTPFPGEYAFLCGLLHDVGMAATLLVLAEHAGASRPSAERITAAVQATRAESSQLLCAAWGLPMDVQIVVGTPPGLRVGGQVHPLAATVAVAHDLTRQLNAAVDLGAGRAFDLTTEAELALARQTLELTDKRMAAIVGDAKKRFARR